MNCMCFTRVYISSRLSFSSSRSEFKCGEISTKEYVMENLSWLWLDLNSRKLKQHSIVCNEKSQLLLIAFLRNWRTHTFQVFIHIFIFIFQGLCRRVGHNYLEICQNVLRVGMSSFQWWWYVMKQSQDNWKQWSAVRMHQSCRYCNALYSGAYIIEWICIYCMA